MKGGPVRVAYSLTDVKAAAPAAQLPEGAPNSGYAVRVPRPYQNLRRLVAVQPHDSSETVESKLAEQVADAEDSLEWVYIRLSDLPEPAPYSVLARVEGTGEQARGLYKIEYRTSAAAFKFCRPAHVRDGRVQPAELPQFWSTPEEAAAAVRRAIAIGRELNLGLTGQLSFSRIDSVGEWSARVASARVDVIKAENEREAKAAREQVEAAKRRLEAAQSMLGDEGIISSFASEPAAPAPAKPSSPASDWQSTEHVGIRQRTRADGSVVYQARRSGEVSPTFDTLEEAQAWKPARRATPPEIKAAIESLS
jgi:hypothetical protein